MPTPIPKVPPPPDSHARAHVCRRGLGGLLFLLLAPAVFAADPATPLPDRIPAIEADRAPLQVFLYIDPFEVRKEITVRPDVLQRWMDLGLPEGGVLSIADQDRVREQAAAFLAVMNPVTIDGRSIPPRLDQAHFLDPSLPQPGLLNPGQEVDLSRALLGLSFSYPLSAAPGHVLLEWELFDDSLTNLPALVQDERGQVSSSLEAAHPVLEWRRPTDRAEAYEWVTLPAPRRATLPLPLASLLCTALALAWMVWRSLRKRPWPAARWPALLLLVGAVLLLPFGRLPIPHPLSRPAMVNDAEARLLVEGLLRNLYHAFDYREESRIYDALSRSVAGDLLERTYLETMRGLALEEQGGACVRVDTVKVVDVQPSPTQRREGFVARCTWEVSGSVGHWGHEHQRHNRYRADLTLRPHEDAWLLTNLNLLDEERR